ncbi:MAG: carbon-nitrogen family hydrolase [Pirellulales bacterium]
MQIVACQLDIAWEDKPANHERVRAMLETAAVKPGALVALPEMFATGFSMHVETIAEPEDGPTHAFLGELARELKSFVAAGVVTRARDGRGRNEAVVFAPDGGQLARYSKMYPFSLAGETKHYEAGAGVTIFPWHDFSVAPFVCYDLRFPEVFRHAVRAGAELMVVIANWPLARDAHWLALLRARAIENQCYVVGVNRAGDDPHVHYGGHSLVVGPRGETVAEAGDGPEVLAAEIELAPLVEYRRQFPALADMRREFLGG